MAMGSPSYELTPEQQERRRLVAASLLRAGWRQVDVAEELGVTEGAVSQWARTLREQGASGLLKHPRPGRPSRLSPTQWAEVAEVLNAGAKKAGFPTERWTLRRIAVLLQRRWGVRYHPRSLSEHLHRLGLSPHRPRPRAKERNEQLIRAWLLRDWPRIKRGLEEAGGRLPSWTRRVVRFGPDWEPPGRPSGSPPFLSG